MSKPLLTHTHTSLDHVHNRPRVPCIQLNRGSLTGRWFASRVGALLLAIIAAVITVQKLTLHRRAFVLSGNGFGLKTGKHGGVAAEDGTCSQIGIEVLKENGTAVDAAIASGLCIGGIGGGGFMMIRLPNGEGDFIDFRENAPAASSQNIGELRGYELAHNKYGRLPWSRILAPSIRLCTEGFIITEELYDRMVISQSFLNSSPGFRETFTVTNPRTNQTTLRKSGSRMFRPKLAQTLAAVSRGGADAFYKGVIADSIVRTVQSNSGILTKRDMQDYKPRVRKPIVGSYRGRRVMAAPPPASGSVLLEILNILEGYDLRAPPAATDLVNVGRIVEAFKWGFAARTELGDPDYLNITKVISTIIDKTNAQHIREKIKDFQTFPVDYYHPKFDMMETPGTTHISVVDNAKMAVSLTSTINMVFGAQLMDVQSGVILNNEMDDFSTPNVTNGFGLPPSRNNYIHPGKRPLSSACPTIIDHDDFVAVYGASGGSRIITAVAQVIINSLDYGKDAYAAVAEPRMHHQLMPTILTADHDYSPAALRALVLAGHAIKVLPKGAKLSEVQTVILKDGVVYAASDPRKRGVAAAY